MMPTRRRRRPQRVALPKAWKVCPRGQAIWRTMVVSETVWVPTTVASSGQVEPSAYTAMQGVPPGVYAVEPEMVAPSGKSFT